MKATVGVFLLCFLISTSLVNAESILVKKERTGTGRMHYSFSNTDVNIDDYPIAIMFPYKSPEHKQMIELEYLKERNAAKADERTKQTIAALQSEVKHKIDMEKRRLQDNLKECEQNNRLLANAERCKAPIEEAIKRLGSDPEYYYYKRNLEGR